MDRRRTEGCNELNQLIRENNEVLGKTVLYEYDLGGNLVSVKTYPYTTSATVTETPATETGTFDTVWKDKLLTWNGTAMTYDAIGNMLSKRTIKYTWTQGRKLSAVDNGKKIQYFMTTQATVRKRL